MEIIEIYHELEKLKERFESLSKNYEELCKAARRFLDLLSVRHGIGNLPTKNFKLTDELDLRFGDEYIYFSFPLYALHEEEILMSRGLNPGVEGAHSVARTFYILDHAREILQRLYEIEEELAEEDRRVCEALRRLREIVGTLAMMKRVGE